MGFGAKKIQMKSKFLLQLLILKLNKFHNCEASLSFDGTEGIVRTSAGVLHPKEESLTVYIPDVYGQGEFRMSFSPITNENCEIIIKHIIDNYGVWDILEPWQTIEEIPEEKKYIISMFCSFLNKCFDKGYITSMQRRQCRKIFQTS